MIHQKRDFVNSEGEEKTVPKGKIKGKKAQIKIFLRKKQKRACNFPQYVI